MSLRIDLTGKRFGKLVVQKMIYGNDRTMCECLCDCGNRVIKGANDLKRAKQDPSCGCNNIDYLRKRFAKNIEGKKFGRLTVIETIWSKESQQSTVRCICDCEKEVIKYRHYVMDGSVKSCGCLLSEIASKNHSRDYTNYVSDFGVKVIKPVSKNKYNQQLWECECGLCHKHFIDLPIRIKNNHVRSCGCLVSSSSESFIAKFLDDNSIEYKTQFTYDDLINKNGYKLRFDFAIIKNGKVFYLIEYDGKQHFEPIKYFGGEEGFVIRQEYDELKNHYCVKNNIPLLRLPYYLSQSEIKEKILSIMKP